MREYEENADITQHVHVKCTKRNNNNNKTHLSTSTANPKYLPFDALLKCLRVWGLRRLCIFTKFYSTRVISQIRFIFFSLSRFWHFLFIP